MGMIAVDVVMTVIVRMGMRHRMGMRMVPPVMRMSNAGSQKRSRCDQQDQKTTDNRVKPTASRHSGGNHPSNSNFNSRSWLFQHRPTAHNEVRDGTRCVKNSYSHAREPSRLRTCSFREAQKTRDLGVPLAWIRQRLVQRSATQNHADADSRTNRSYSASRTSAAEARPRWVSLILTNWISPDSSRTSVVG
ncbi:hypothetical protein Poly24_26990 [Rosistilla carotiformis]|uniref:Uncharacterized protein n=1 Tax=Rosistilla carotiformis TaxID=2528017 RepID=A0A518JU28_9BACT|nr:hypothetical protein Poly24_26990 [Rosistilla carotiformis]